MTTTQSALFTLKDLSPRLTGHLVLPEDPAYDHARQVFNKSVNKRPAALARCANVDDVVKTVQWARLHGIPLSVRGGGHDLAGRCLCNDGIVIDCSQMNALNIDPQKRTARVQGGAIAGDLMTAAQQHELATAAGSISSVGLGGLTLGGGYGALLGKCGLVADNLLSAEVVTADGRLLTTNSTDHPDLYWGLRGGGGNFGVAVSLEYRLYPISKVLSGLLLYPLDQAKDVLRYFNEFIKTVPDELTIQSGFFQLPDSTKVLFLSPVYCGSFSEGEKILEPLHRLGKPLSKKFQTVTYVSHIHSIDNLAPKGRHYFCQTQSLDSLQTETIEILVEQARSFSSPYSLLSFHHFHGKASRVGISETAFGLRQDHLMIEVIAAWEQQSPELDRKHVEWTHRGSSALVPYAFEGGYINLLNVTETERIPLAFGPNYQRLLDVKRTYDPDDVFHSTVGHISPTPHK
jgi:FAD binding domain/Berberine and berberine like